LTDFSGKAKYLNVEATTVDVQSDILALATFSKGVPLSSTSQRAFLYFQQNSQAVQHYAENINFTNDATVTALDSAVSCSYAGGCILSITQGGFLANLVSESSNRQAKRPGAKP
jgi:hypothetical protein